MSVGVEKLMWKMLRQQSLNNYKNIELKFMHMILCKMYNYTLNILLFKEALSNTGCRDDSVLCRKVPVEIWKLLYDGCKEMNITDDMLRKETNRAALWMHFNSNSSLLVGLTNYVTHRLGLNHDITINPNNITDGNYLYNLGGILPSRILMSIAYCLVFWGKQEAEPWVRYFTCNIFLLYLIVSGHLKLQKSVLSASASVGYLGPIQIITSDIIATKGIIFPMVPNSTRPDSKTLDYLFIFNNNILI